MLPLFDGNCDRRNHHFVAGSRGRADQSDGLALDVLVEGQRDHYILVQLTVQRLGVLAPFRLVGKVPKGFNRLNITNGGSGVNTALTLRS